jgi:hypothetical protein
MLWPIVSARGCGDGAGQLGDEAEVRLDQVNDVELVDELLRAEQCAVHRARAAAPRANAQACMCLHTTVRT